MVFSQLMEDLPGALASDLDASFQSVVERMGPRVYWGLRRMYNNHQEAEDLTQETFIRAYKALSGYDTNRIRDMEVEPWIWTIALNLGRNHMRDRARRPTYVELVETGETDPEMIDGAAWDRRFSELNRHQRTAVALRHVVGLSIGQIAQATGRPEGTVKADIHRGLGRLKTIMEEEG